MDRHCLAHAIVPLAVLDVRRALRTVDGYCPGDAWADPKDSLTGFEQLLYLRQPGYGTSYITGKLLVDRLIAEYAHQQELAGRPFVLREFMDRFNGAGMIPVKLVEDEMVSSSARMP